MSSHRALDASGCYVTPGLIDLQVNGSQSCNLWADPNHSQLNALRLELANHGVTSFLPTLITDEIGHLKKNIAFLQSCGAGLSQLAPKPDANGARIPGIHREGPCLSPQKPGVHPRQWLQPLTPALMEEIVSDSVALITLAPELEPSGDSIHYLLHRNIRVSLGHSNASYEEARSAFEQGVRLM